MISLTRRILSFGAESCLPEADENTGEGEMRKSQWVVRYSYTGVGSDGVLMHSRIATHNDNILQNFHRK